MMNSMKNMMPFSGTDPRGNGMTIPGIPAGQKGEWK